MPSGRPGGNPDFGSKYRFVTDRDEPLVFKVHLRVAKSMKVQLDVLGKRRSDFIRDAIAEKLAREETHE